MVKLLLQAPGCDPNLAHPLYKAAYAGKWVWVRMRVWVRVWVCGSVCGCGCICVSASVGVWVLMWGVAGVGACVHCEEMFLLFVIQATNHHFREVSAIDDIKAVIAEVLPIKIFFSNSLHNRSCGCGACAYQRKQRLRDSD